MKHAYASTAALFSGLVLASPQRHGDPEGYGHWDQWADENSITGYPTNSAAWSSWASAKGLPTATSEWSSWASSHWGGVGWPTSAYSDFASWTSAASLTAVPTDTAQWDSITSAHPLPSDLTSAADWWKDHNFPGGSAWPSAWTTNSGGLWNGPPGWHGAGAGGDGPFGPGRGDHGWGSGPWAQDGSWTTGAWTKWWGTDACPASTWSGWTDGPWASVAPWTTWSACTASTTASSTITVTTTDGAGSSITSLSTSFAIRVAEATGAEATGAVITTNSDGLTVTSTSSDSGALPTHVALIGSAAGMVGVAAAALLL